jgi:formiminotetrahydrofolate cyclodeaminase
MVCRLSISKKGFESFESELEEIFDNAQALSKSLLKRIDLDTEAFNGVMAGFKMPKETDDEKAARRDAVQVAYKEAVQSPLGIARECLAVLRLAENLGGKSNPNTLSDLGVASQQAYAGLAGAIMNVNINLPSIKDRDFVDATLSETSTFLEDGGKIRDAVHKYVSENSV